MLKKNPDATISKKSGIIIIILIAVFGLCGITVRALANNYADAQDKGTSKKDTVVQPDLPVDSPPPPPTQKAESTPEPQPIQSPVRTTLPDTSKCDYVEGLAGIGVGQSNYDSEHRSYLADKALYDGWDIYSPEEQYLKISESYLTHKTRAESAYNDYFKEVSGSGCTPKIARPIFSNP